MNRLRLIASILGILFISACTIYKEYPIEVLKSGEITVPPKIKNVAVIYRNFKYPGDTLQHFYKIDHRLVKAKNDPGNLDSLLVTASLNKLVDNLKKNNTFRKVQLFPYHLFKRHYSEKIPPMSPDILQKIGDVAEADWIISLETFSWFFSAYPENFDTPESNEVITVAVWGIYDLTGKKNIFRKTMIDTVFWNGYDSEANYIYGYNPPSRLKALQIASVKAGEDYAKKFYASWQTVYRIYSIPPLPDFMDAAYYFEEGQLDYAIDLWKKYTERRNGKLAINAYYNLALAFEMKDKIETARKYLKQANKLAEYYRAREELKMIMDYQDILTERLKEINSINK